MKKNNLSKATTKVVRQKRHQVARNALSVILSLAMVLQSSPFAYAEELLDASDDAVIEYVAEQEPQEQAQENYVDESAESGESSQSNEDSQQGTANVTFALQDAYVVYDSSVLAGKQQTVQVPAGERVRFTAYANDGFQLASVHAATPQGEVELAGDEQGIYSLEGDLTSGDVTVTVTAEPVAARADANCVFTAPNEQDTFEYVDKAQSLKVTARLSNPELLPQGVEFKVTPVTQKSKKYNYDAYLEALNNEAVKAAEAQGKGVDEAQTYTADDTLLYDIAFFAPKADENGDPIPGEKVEVPLGAGTVEVEFDFLKDQLSQEIDVDNAQALEVVHLPLKDEVRQEVDSTAQATDITKDDVVVEYPKQDTVTVDVEQEKVGFTLVSLSLVGIHTLAAPAANATIQNIRIYGYALGASYGNSQIAPWIIAGDTLVKYDLDALPSFGFGEGQAFNRACSWRLSGESVRNVSGTTWYCVGYVPVNWGGRPGSADRDPEYQYSNWCFEGSKRQEAVEAAKEGVADQLLIPYGYDPKNPQEGEPDWDTVLKAIRSTGGNIMTVWAVVKPSQIEPHSHDLKPILDATPIAYQGTTEGVEETGVEVTHTVTAGNHYTYYVTYNYVITDKCNADVIYIDTSSYKQDVVVSGAQPGDDVVFRINVTDASGAQYQYVDNAGAMGTVMTAADGESVIGKGFEGYDIAGYSESPDGKIVYSQIGRRTLNPAIIDLYNQAKFNRIASDPRDFVGMCAEGLRDYYDVYDTAPLDVFVGLALYSLGYGNGTPLYDLSGEAISPEDAIVYMFVDDSDYIRPWPETINEKYANQFAQYARDYLDDFYLDWINANTEQDYKDFREVSLSDPQILKSLFYGADGTQLSEFNQSEETNQVVSNLMYYTFYNYLWPASPNGENWQGLYEIMHDDSEEVHQYFAEGGNKFAPYFADQWHATDGNEDNEHTLQWFMNIEGEGNANAMQNTKFFAAAQIKLIRPNPVTLNINGTKTMVGRTFQYESNQDALEFTIQGSTYQTVTDDEGNLVLTDDTKLDDYATPMPKDDKGNIVRSVTIEPAKGTSVANILFGGVTFTSKDSGKTFVYTLQETVPSEDKNGVTYDKDPRTLTVSVAVNKETGKLELTVTDAKRNTKTITEDSESKKLTVDWENVYKTSGTAPLSVTKSFVDGTWPASQEFSFTITPQRNAPAPKIDGETVTSVTATSDEPQKSLGTVTFTHDNMAQVNDAGEPQVDPDGNTIYLTEKDFTYRIQEVVPEDAETKTVDGKEVKVKDGVTYDTQAHTVTLHVKDKGDGTFEVTYGGTDATTTDGKTTYGSNLTIVNTYDASATGELTVTKSFGNQAWPANQSFSFAISPKAGAPEPAETQVTTTSTSRVKSFGEISYTLADLKKTDDQTGLKCDDFTYEIREVLPQGVTAQNPVKNGVTYDTTTHEVVVHVADNGDGTLSVSYEGTDAVTDDEGVSTANKNLTINNSYDAQTSIVISGTKEIDVQGISPAGFAFTLAGEGEGAPQLHATSGEDGTFTFDALRYTLSDLAQTNEEAGIVSYPAKSFKYTLSEDDLTQAQLDAGFSKPANQQPVTITVRVSYDAAKGELSAVATPANGSYAFTNSYKATGELPLSGTKRIDKRAIKPGDTFTFQVTEGNKVVSTGSFTATQGDTSGTIAYEPIQYVYDASTQNAGVLGEHTYTVSETAATADGVTKSSQTHTVKVNVTDNGKGTLTVTQVSGSDDPAKLDFTNAYEATGSITFGGTKSIDKRAIKAGETFEFVVNEVSTNAAGKRVTTEVARGTSDDKGKISYETINYQLNKDRDDTGEHTYVVSETAYDKDGVKSTTNTQTITVTVADNTNGTLSVTPSSDKDKLDFINTYAATGSITFKGSKSMKGRDLLPGETYSFPVTDANGNVIVTGTSDDQGNITFPALNYDIDCLVQDGKFLDSRDYDYTVTETKVDANGVTSSGESYKVKVTVTDNKDGSLNVTSQDSYEQLDFVNTYDAKGDITIKGAKQVDKMIARKDLQGFTFQLTGEGLDKPLTATTAADGTFAFDKINYTLEDAGTKDEPKVYTYTIDETNVPSGYTAPATQTVTVRVWDEADGKLHVQSNMPANGFVLINTYEATGDITFQGTKRIDKRDLLQGDVFQFTVEEEGTSNVWSVTCDPATGKIDYPTISYVVNAAKDDTGEHVYKVSEAKVSANGVTSDKTTYTVTVKVEDQDSKDLKVTTTGDDPAKLDFTNTYEATGLVNVSGTKQIDGRDVAADDAWNFTLTGKDGAPIRVQGDAGMTLVDELSTSKLTLAGTGATFTFPQLHYTLDDLAQTDDQGNVTYAASKTFTYQVSESKLAGDTDATITIDGEPKTFTVTVAQHLEDGAPNGTLDVTATGLANLAFVNDYQAHGSVLVEGSKALHGRAFNNGADGQTVDPWYFTVAATQGSPLDMRDARGNAIQRAYITRMTNDEWNYAFNLHYTLDDLAVTDASGNVTSYDKSRIFHYTVTENGEAKGVTNDADATRTIAVKVTDPRDGSGTLTVELLDDASDSLAFINTYEATGSYTPQGTKTLTGRDMAQGEFAFQIKEGNEVVATGTNAAAKNGEKAEVTFDTIAYTLADVGEHTYTVSEIEPTAGVSAKTQPYTITVTVADNGDGTLDVKASDNAQALDFVNTYEATGTLLLDGVKYLEGRNLTGEDAFTFQLAEGSKVLGTTTNNAQGTFAFQPIAYTLADVGEHTYTVRETSQDGKGVTVDTKIYLVKVNVTDTGLGTLDVVVDDGRPQELVFTNTYRATGSYTPQGTKTLTGRDLAQGEFDFIVTDEDDTVVSMGSNAAAKDGEAAAIEFSPITYTIADAGKTFTYHVSEVEPDEELGITQTGTTGYDLLVHVTDNGDGTLKAERVADAGGNTPAIAFTNEYEAHGTATVELTKELVGLDLEDGQFTFNVADANGTVIDTVTNDEDGKVSFTVSYDQDDVKTGWFSYYVTEVNDEQPGMTYDSHTELVRVHVEYSDKLDSNLKTTVYYEQDHGGEQADFVNTYTTKGSAPLTAVKTIDARDFRAGDEFTFTVRAKDGGPLPTNPVVTIKPTSGKSAAIDFGTLNFDGTNAGRTYLYEIAETAQVAGVTNAAPVEVTVTVSADDGSGKLDVEVSPNGEDLTFDNTYEAQGSVAFGGTKSIDTRQIKEGETFTFEVLENGEVVATGTNDDKGAISYGTINYVLNAQRDDTGTHTYTVREQKVDAAGVTSSATEHVVTVEVADNGDGTLKVTPSSNAQSLDFINTYAATGSLPLQGTKTMRGRELAQGETFTFEVAEQGEGGRVWTATSDDQGKISYPTITYSIADLGEHVYDVHETTQDANGVVVDTTVHTVKVTVGDNGDGTLSVTKAADSADPSKLDFVNTYSATGEGEVLVTKTLTGRDWADDDSFEFTISPIGHAPAFAQDSVTVTADSVDYTESFGRVAFTQAGTYSYTVQETAGDVAGVTYDSTTKIVTFDVVDDGKGNLVAAPNTQLLQTVAFTNAYGATGTATLHAAKLLNGEAPGQDEAFSFQLYAGNVATGTPIQTVTNTASGAVDFAPLAYDLDDLQDGTGTFAYTIVEVVPQGAQIGASGKPELNGYVYDNTPRHATVTVTDDGAGTLQTSVTYEGLGADETVPTFRNEHLDIVVPLSFDKVYTGSDAAEGMFTFSLFEADEDFNVIAGGSAVQTLTNGAFQDGVAQVSTQLEYTQAGIHRYVVFEAANDDAAADPAQILVTVMVSDDGSHEVTYAMREANGDITTVRRERNGEAVVAPDEQAQRATLYNNNQVTPMGRARRYLGSNEEASYAYFMPEIQKRLENGALEGGEFTFQLHRDTADGEVVEQVSNDRDGRVPFGALVFDDSDEGKTYTYVITEAIPALAKTNDTGDQVYQGIVYTKDTVRLTVTVGRGTNNELVATGTYEQVDAQTGKATKTDAPQLVNTYDTVVIHAVKYSRDTIDYSKADPYENAKPVAGARYGLWMVNADGQDIYMGRGRNQLAVEGSVEESGTNGDLYYDLPLIEGVAYYFKEEGDKLPNGHLLDPYPTDYFTLLYSDGEGFRIRYEYEFGSTEEFLSYVQSIAQNGLETQGE